MRSSKPWLSFCSPYQRHAHAPHRHSVPTRASKSEGLANKETQTIHIAIGARSRRGRMAASAIAPSAAAARALARARLEELPPRHVRGAAAGAAVTATVGTVQPATDLVRWPRCYSTLLFRDDNASVLRRVFEEDEVMVQAWVKSLLATTSLPIFVLHTQTPPMQPVLRSLRNLFLEHRRQLHFRPVDVVHGGGWGVVCADLQFS